MMACNPDTIKNPEVSREQSLKTFGVFSRILLDSDAKHIWSATMPILKYLGYFSAPASTKFHLCTAGGLLTHSVNVTSVALDLASLKFPALEPWRVLAAGLLHDVGKCGFTADNGLEPRYIKNPEPMPAYEKAKKWWAPYLYHDSKPMFTVRDLSALYVSKWGYPWDVVQAVMIHDGLFNDANKDYFRTDMEPLSLVINAADWIACKGLETKHEALHKRYE